MPHGGQEEGREEIKERKRERRREGKDMEVKKREERRHRDPTPERKGPRAKYTIQGQICRYPPPPLAPLPNSAFSYELISGSIHDKVSTLKIQSFSKNRAANIAALKTKLLIHKPFGDILV